MTDPNIQILNEESSVDVNKVVVSVVENTINISAPGPQGPPGPAGPAGPSGTSTTYTHTQSSASTSWVITHNLNKKPSVTIVDSGGNVQIGEIRYDSNNQVTVTFAAAFGGYAYLN